MNLGFDDVSFLKDANFLEAIRIFFKEHGLQDKLVLGAYAKPEQDDNYFIEYNDDGGF